MSILRVAAQVRIYVWEMRITKPIVSNCHVLSINHLKSIGLQPNNKNIENLFYCYSHKDGNIKDSIAPGDVELIKNEKNLITIKIRD